jgi:hypothetical protein
MPRSKRKTDGEQLDLFDPAPVTRAAADQGPKPIAEMTLEELRAAMQPYLEARYESQRQRGLRSRAASGETAPDPSPTTVPV